MRIQHNITAMNSYRNYNTNNSALGKNLEKLSSGYKVNRAGDDAAGLAISEKMRAQITGIEGATKNAKDGISLIQTAEGALTEVHSMLNRMTSLAEQSANGTYDNDVDRAQLQKEIESLKSEINRVADSTNYNGIKLLDGSLAGAGGGNGKSRTATLTLSDAMAAAALSQDGASAYSATMASAAGAVTATSDGVYQITYTDENGDEQTLSVTINAGKDTAADVTYSVNGGEKQKAADKYSAGGASATKVGNILAKALQDALGDNFTVTNASGKLTVTAKQEGATNVELRSVGWDIGGTGVTTFTKVNNTAAGLDAYNELDAQAVTAWGTSTDDPNKVVFTVDGKKFAFVKAGKMLDAAKALGDDVNMIEIAGTSAAASEVTKMVELINSKIGYKGATANTTKIDFKPVNGAGGATVGGLVLQIGDTAESFNKMTVAIADMHATSIGIGGIDISTQDGASDAMKKIKDAINKVSDTRGGLGALQNRLDHTINNLGVMRENIQNAESLIRDTDVAEEMMAYTKNSILNQSAQAMLAQANQLPQGVLQLLG